MLRDFLYLVVEMITMLHTGFLKLNDSFSAGLTDKQLHFLVIGILGMGIFFIVHPVFCSLIRKGHEKTISWIYTTTLILVITFAIEIGQKITNTGNMEFADIVFGVVGFFAMYLGFLIIRWVVIGLKKLLIRGKYAKK